MAFRPHWYDDERRGFGGAGWRRLGGGAIGSWSAVRLVLTVTIAAFLLQSLVALAAGPGSDPLAEWAGLRAYWPKTGFDFNLFFPLQLVSYMVLHADLGHLLWNMLYVFFFGNELEARLGKSGFLRLYLAGGLVGGLCQWIAGLVTGSTLPTIGASGAVYTVMVLYALTWPRRLIWLLFPPLPMPVLLLVGIKIVGDLLGFASGVGPVAHLVHLGGAGVGFLWHWRGDVVEHVADRLRRQRATRLAAKDNEDRREMDRILAKIQVSGLSSLSAGEREFLDRRSQKLRQQGR